MHELCKACGRPLKNDEIAMHKKLFSRESAQYLCLTCQATHFHVTEESLRERIAYFKSIGCTLFSA